MGLIVTCGSCQASYQVGERFAGQKTKCPKCRNEMVLPQATPDPAGEVNKGQTTLVGRAAPVMATPPTRRPPAKKAVVEVVPREQLLQEIRGSLEGEIEAASVPFSYHLSLLLSSAVMVLLIVLYIAVIIAVCYGVYVHTMSDAWIITSVRGKEAAFALIVSLASILAGAGVIFFLFKPLFARAGRQIPPVSLKKEEEPLLFEFVERIARVVGAPRPSRIDVDVNVNASAGFRKGVWSMIIGNDLVLTIGLPLVAGMNTRQLSGVLAHEFGHFRQGAGMRMSYLVRRISFWFMRVVYERDAWDEWLYRMTRDDSSSRYFVFQFIRSCVWLTRKVLWGLMMLGHLSSGFLLRQMEFDADRFETQMAGSETFEKTSRMLGLLSVAFRGAISDLHAFYREERLGDNLPKLLMHNAQQMPKEVKDSLEKLYQERKTEVFDTHPCDRDRVAAAKALNSPGLFRIEWPSILLFSNFGTLARQATLTYYREEIGEEFKENMVHSIDLLVERQNRDQETVKSLERFFQGSFSLLRPLKLADDLLELEDTATEANSIRKTREIILAEKEKYAEALKQFDEMDTAFYEIEQATALLEANFSFPPETFKVPLNSPERIQTAKRSAQTSLCGTEARMKAMESAVIRRIQTGLRLLGDQGLEGKTKDIAALRAEVARLLGAQQLLTEMFPRFMNYRLTGAALLTLYSQLESNRDKPILIESIKGRMRKMHQQLGEIFKRLVLAKYPLDHGQADISIADYLLKKLPTDEDLSGLLGSYGELMEKLPVLCLKVTARLAAISEQVETALGLPLMPDPPEKKAEEDEAGKKREGLKIRA